MLEQETPGKHRTALSVKIRCIYTSTHSSVKLTEHTRGQVELSTHISAKHLLDAIHLEVRIEHVTIAENDLSLLSVWLPLPWCCVTACCMCHTFSPREAFSPHF